MKRFSMMTLAIMAVIFSKSTYSFGMTFCAMNFFSGICAKKNMKRLSSHGSYGNISKSQKCSVSSPIMIFQFYNSHFSDRRCRCRFLIVNKVKSIFEPFKQWLIYLRGLNVFLTQHFSSFQWIQSKLQEKSTDSFIVFCMKIRLWSIIFPAYARKCWTCTSDKYPGCGKVLDPNGMEAALVVCPAVLSNPVCITYYISSSSNFLFSIYLHYR